MKLNLAFVVLCFQSECFFFCFCFLNKHYINVTSGYGFAKLTKCLQKMWPVCCCSSVSPFTFDVYSNHIMPLGLLPYCF